MTPEQEVEALCERILDKFNQLAAALEEALLAAPTPNLAPLQIASPPLAPLCD